VALNTGWEGFESGYRKGQAEILQVDIDYEEAPCTYVHIVSRSDMCNSV
jgi:hypothetical protein